MYIPQKLKYSYDALEPYIDTKTMESHYNNHYLGYLNKLNNLLNSLGYDYRHSLDELYNHIDIFDMSKRDDILFLLGGVINHELFFDTIGPNNNIPSGLIMDKIAEDFGNYGNFKNEFIKNANELVGSGFTSLVVDKNGDLKIINTSNQDSPLFYGFIPILTLDLWEHAYYLKYLNRRDLYIDAFFNTIDFDALNKKYEKAQKV